LSGSDDKDAGEFAVLKLARQIRHFKAPWLRQFQSAADPQRGVVTEAGIKVVSPTSNRTFVQAVTDQQLASWITGHCHA
jgi:hypothetical protein